MSERLEDPASIVVNAVEAKVEKVAVPNTGEHGPSLVICEDEISDMVNQASRQTSSKSTVQDKAREIKQLRLENLSSQKSFKKAYLSSSTSCGGGHE